MDKFCKDCIHNEVCQYGAIPPHINRCNDKDTYKSIDEFLNGTKDGKATARLQGEWKEKRDKKGGWFECDKCGHEPLRDFSLNVVLSNYCPNCGAKMKGGE